MNNVTYCHDDCNLHHYLVYCNLSRGNKLMIIILFLAIALICAIQAIRVRHLISAALWLAGVSASAAITMYLLGAKEVAVIELSVGAGLVTILFVFAISIAGADDLNHQAAVPKLFSVGLMAVAAVIVGLLFFPIIENTSAQAAETGTFSIMMWEARGMDVLLQIGLIFGAVMCILGLLGEDVGEFSKETAVAHQSIWNGNGAEMPALVDMSELSVPQPMFEKEEVA